MDFKFLGLHLQFLMCKFSIHPTLGDSVHDRAGLFWDLLLLYWNSGRQFLSFEHFAKCFGSLATQVASALARHTPTTPVREESPFYRLGKTLRSVHAHNKAVLHAPCLQLTEDGKPPPCATGLLRFAAGPYGLDARFGLILGAAPWLRLTSTSCKPTAFDPLRCTLPVAGHRT